MSHKLKLLHVAALVALTAATGAHATLRLGNATTNGSSSLAFVAIDNAGTISYTADLSVQFADFLPLIASQTSFAGALSAPGTSAVFNLRTNTYSLNGVAQAGTRNWSGNLNSFLNNASVSGGEYQWGVIAVDSITAAVISPTNFIRSQNILFTSGAVVDYDTSNDSGFNAAAIAAGAGQINNFYAASNVASGNTHTAGVFGSNTATSGPAFLGEALVNGGVGNFSQQFGNNNYLQAPGAVSYFSWSALGSPSVTATLGATVGFGADPALPSVWSWDAASGNLTYTVPIPEPGTYAMLLAGLAAMSLVVRRRAG